MRNSFRFVASTALGAILLLTIGVGATLAKAPGTVVYDLNDTWCFQSDPELYCTVRTGTLTVETRPNGDSVGTVELTTTTEVTAQGAFVSTYTSTVRDRSISDEDGAYTVAMRERTRWTDGEQTCQSLIRLRIADFEVITDTIKTVCH